MVQLITVQDIQTLIQQVSLEHFIQELIARLKIDFSQWSDFQKTPRHATHYPQGVIEIMLTSNADFYAFKYINGHPKNPQQEKSTVVGLGVLADVHSGYPLMISEMTLLTALRTAATSALAATYLAPTHTNTMAMVGTGSQSEFQVLAHHIALGINQVYYYDPDPQAMTKFAANLDAYPIKLIACKDVFSTLCDADMITTATAVKARAQVLQADWVKPGSYINALGGDCPGKTELDLKILKNAKIVIEHLAQTQHEGEIQTLPEDAVYAELWEIVSGLKPGRENEQQIFVYDSVGFAIEDFTILRYVYELAQQYSLGQPLDLIPKLPNPKNLFSLILPPKKRFRS